jgi:hypothetical protein
MSIELISMLGGGVAGFLMRFIAAQAEMQAQLFERVLRAQEASDVSADKAAVRSPGSWVRRVMALVILFGVVVGPFILAIADIPVVVESSGPWWDILDIFPNWDTISGFILLPEVRQGMLALVGFYFGSSQVKL